MNCVVTAGPTYEPLDEVRRLTNFSTGRLGSELVNFLAARGHHVTLLIGQQATWRGECQPGRMETFTTTDDLRSRLHTLASQPVDAIFHAAAVSDFAFGKTWQRTADGSLIPFKAGKISSRLDNVLVELTPTGKIIADLRDWFPRACLTGWKFEVDGKRPNAIAKAEQQLTDYRTTACVVNGRAYGEGFGLVTGAGRIRHLADREALFAALEELLARRAIPGSSSP